MLAASSLSRPVLARRTPLAQRCRVTLRRSQNSLLVARDAKAPSTTTTTTTTTEYDLEVAARKTEAQAWIQAWKEEQAGSHRNGNGNGNGNGATNGVTNGVTNGTTNGVAAAVVPEAIAAADPLRDFAALLLPLGVLYAADKSLAYAFKAAAIKFPSALVGMVLVFAVLCVVGDKTADKALSFFMPALDWISRWLPLFYVASLVTLPLALNGIPSADLLKLVAILMGGMVATLLFTSKTAVFIREVVKTPMKEIAKAKPSPPFTKEHYASWGAVFVISLLVTSLAPAQYGFQMALPLGLAATIGGYLLGCLVPKDFHGFLHPVVVCALATNAACWLHGQLMGWTYEHALHVYFAKGAGPMGAGDVLMNLLGVVIVSFGFRIYQQRTTMQRHAPEIMGATLLSSLFSLFSTAFAARFLGLAPDLARAVVPRSVTVALALPIASQLDAPLAITAAAVLLQGLLGANFGPMLMTLAGVKDTIARGLAAAATAGGLGTASLTSKEPEALPFCALSYSMVGVLSTLIAAIPAVRYALCSIIGG